MLSNYWRPYPRPKGPIGSHKGDKFHNIYVSGFILEL